jgi:hypothetical protein
MSGEDSCGTLFAVNGTKKILLGAAKILLGAMKTHRMVRENFFIPYDDASRGTEKKFYTIE